MNVMFPFLFVKGSQEKILIVGELADGGDIVGGTLPSSITFFKLLTSSGLGVVKLGLEMLHRNKFFIKKGNSRVHVNRCEWSDVNYYCIITMVGYV